MTHQRPPLELQTVLVVDDSDLNRAVIERILVRRDLRVLCAGDGAEGAVIALRELPDVVITDLEMPVMDGYQLARLLKSDPSTQNIPILILTSHGEAPARFWSLETGADAYLVKSGIETELVDTVEELLRRSSPGTPNPNEPVQSSLDVLARVSRHLDRRLLEAVLVNRILESGMQAATLDDASRAILDTVGHIVDAWALGLGIAEEHSATLFLSLSADTGRQNADRLVERLAAALEIGPSIPREVRILGGSESGSGLDPKALECLPLPLREARAMLAVLPREAGYASSREHELLEQGRRQLALVLDNARLAERLRELSMRDGLTRLLNRRTIQQRLYEEVERAVRYRHTLSLLICDLDHFKKINDTYGHQAGDRALVAVAEIFEQQARSHDVAGRFGGEEFLLVLPETHLKDACQVGRRLRDTIANASIPMPDGRSIHITGSIGVAALSELEVEAPPAAEPGGPDAEGTSLEGVTSDGLLRMADQRLYAAKAAGRNQVIP